MLLYTSRPREKDIKNKIKNILTILESDDIIINVDQKSYLIKSLEKRKFEIYIDKKK